MTFVQRLSGDRVSSTFIWEKRVPSRIIMQRPRSRAKPGVSKEQGRGQVPGSLEDHEGRGPLAALCFGGHRRDFGFCPE